jgi:hypothetical protein
VHAREHSSGSEVRFEIQIGELSPDTVDELRSLIVDIEVVS